MTNAMGRYEENVGVPWTLVATSTELPRVPMTRTTGRVTRHGLRDGATKPAAIFGVWFPQQHP